MNRFVFESYKIEELKRKVEGAGVPAPTRVEVIMSLVWTCARNAWRSNLVSPRSTLMLQPMDCALGSLLRMFSPSETYRQCSFLREAWKAAAVSTWKSVKRLPNFARPRNQSTR
ncbi:unnamed protein product [Eruca vesicaria subsp. sativa]|uniref:Uncharacterized protein n=1 Tax=Eruca vesicaria subsp. sativa TaxID=29727 RepID=A0ABC8IZW7_ERUVS|nr:unnamed protein product [Eruca vesicaria subsp. sativa]